MKKYYLILIVAAALLLETMGAVQYFTATRLIRRNQDLAEKVVKMQNHLKTVSSQSSESHYFG